MTFTVKSICETIWKLEEEYELNHVLIQGTYPWQLIRMYLYYEIARKLAIFGSAQQGSLSSRDKISSFLPFIKNSILNNPFSGNNKKDIIIFDHPRKVIFKEEYRDIYSYFLPETLEKNNKSFELIESPYLNKHFTEKKDYIKFNDRILLGSFIHKTRNRNKVPFTDSEREKIANLKIAIENAFPIEIDLFRIIEDHILNFQYEYKKYSELFNKRKPKQIFLVVAYENKAVIAAAKEKNIEIIELQHGTISPYHLGYSYPKKTMKKNGTIKEIEYFPDKILSFGEYWKNASSYPIESEDILATGFPYFQDNSKKYMKIANEKNKKQILFISQGVIGKYLSKFAYKIATALEDYEIIYKLHPGEYNNWRENYEYLNKGCELANFKIIDNSETPLYELFAKSNYQVGAFSTAIYEGLAFNCKTFIVDVPGVEYLEDLIEKNIVKKVENPEEMIEKLANSDFEKYNKNYFFKDYDESIFKEILK